jgi:hypothetical protein
MESRIRNEGKEVVRTVADKEAPASNRQPSDGSRSEYDFRVLNLLFDEKR